MPSPDQRRLSMAALRARRALAGQCRACGNPASRFRCDACAEEHKEQKALKGADPTPAQYEAQRERMRRLRAERKAVARAA